MAYTDDAVKAKLSSLNETQDAIVTVAQWIMFHRRYAERTSQLWMQKLKDSTASKRLNLIYLANEVVQQSKARKREDFVKAFTPIIVEATAIAYKSASLDIQGKLRRVVEVWRHRNIFDPHTQDAVEEQLNQIDRSRSTGRKPTLGGSLFSESTPSIPSELQPLCDAHGSLTRADLKLRPDLRSTTTELENRHSLSNPTDPAPLRAARLSSLVKTLANTSTLVQESIKARKSLLAELDKLTQDHRAGLAADEAQLQTLTEVNEELRQQKDELEDAIARGYTAGADDEDYEPPRPQAEPLTPPPIEAITPPGSPGAEGNVAAADLGSGSWAGIRSSGLGSSGLGIKHAADRTNGASGEAQGEPNVKRRRVDHGLRDEFAAFAESGLLDGIDPAVEEMLK